MQLFTFLMAFITISAYPLQGLVLRQQADESFFVFNLFRQLSLGKKYVRVIFFWYLYLETGYGENPPKKVSNW
jgi:hypothetical protein